MYYLTSILSSNYLTVGKNMFEEIIEYFGSQAELSRALGVSRAAVTQWYKMGAFPPQQCFKIEKLSGGAFMAKDLILGYYGIGENDAS